MFSPSAPHSLALHPRKDIVVTGSDDRLWKMWAFPNGNIIMKGEGHTDWLSGCCFHPRLAKIVLKTSNNPFWESICLLCLS